MEENAGWQRRNWKAGGGNPFLFYVIFGATDVEFTIPALNHRTGGLPHGVDARVFRRREHAEYLSSSYQSGYPWDELVAHDSTLAESVAEAQGAIAFAGEISDPSSLGYLRSTIGVVAWLLDQGGVALYDPFTSQWWRPAEWKERFFDTDAPNPHRHVMIYRSNGDEDDRGLWFHTRGMLKFGRPDLSVSHVSESHHDAVADICNELIEYQAQDGILAEGQRVRHRDLGLFVVNIRGDRDDPEFNNVHIELTPAGA